MSVRADAETLRLLPVFRNCDPVALQILAFSAERVNFDLDDLLLEEGEPGDAAYLIMSGSVDILRGGKVQSVAEEGALLGENAMIAGLSYSLSARARGVVVAAKLPRDVFLRVATEYPDFGRAVIGALSERLSATVRDFDAVRVQLNRSRAFSDI
jgi:CRP/FNR family cyclic AMP-dependent transcriptional regulator